MRVEENCGMETQWWHKLELIYSVYMRDLNINDLSGYVLKGLYSGSAFSF